ncbi:MAG: hypothetical protein LBG19_07970 [Prevotellaceae bacterium]|jgi:transcriptional regulator with XRE-family HTH domain|nr:hypothetical protein [Prevotellaceae bacterium]
MKHNQDVTKEEVDSRIMEIASKLKILRIKKGYSSHESFAWNNGLNRAQYWRVEKGSNITIKTLLTILDIHNMSLKEFFEDFQ